jgi:CO/xanthine dehydrogenase Mo-binding subunit
LDVRAGIDAKGNMVGFDTTHFYPQYKSGPETTAQLAGTPLPDAASSIGGNQFPSRMYRVASTNNRYLVKSIPLKGNWVMAAWLRAGAAPAVLFAGEQVVDELARAAGVDPVAFRVQNVTQNAVERRSLLAVLDAVTRVANWQPKVAASRLSDGNIVSGRGVAWSNLYRSSQNGNFENDEFGWTATAAIADVEVNKKTGKVTAKHIYGAAAAGLAVNPGLIENQLVGGLTQVASRVLAEQYRYDQRSVTSSDFVSYPILRFKDAPKVTPIVVQQSDLRTKGVGEPVSVLAGAAIANAFFDATGVRMQTAPMTPARVRAALKAAGVK